MTIGIITSLLFASYPSTGANSEPRTVYGYVYVNDVIMEPDQVLLIFPGQEVEATLYPDGYYILDFSENIGETGIFNVTVYGDIYTANETITIQQGVYEYEIDLHVTIPPNYPPNKPENPDPANNSENVDLSPTLSVDVEDPDDDPMNVTFYDASDDSLIGTDYNVPSGGTASAGWLNLDYNTEYQWYAIANDTWLENKSDTWTFTTKANNPPNKPINPSPEDGAEDVDINPTLSVDVTDPDGNVLTVYFYNASDDSLIGTDENVNSGATASVDWVNLDYNTEYTWYAIANDSMYENKSDTWSFTTRTKDNEPPIVEITKPTKGIYFRDEKIFPRPIRLTLIIGTITIEANATDDKGIEKVEFYINGKLKGNDTIEPYTYNWTRDRIRLFHIFVIKVVAYDTEGETATDQMIVRKFL